LPMGVRVNCSGRFSARIAYKGKQIHLGALSAFSTQLCVPASGCISGRKCIIFRS
jgi:hypothetical protein